MNYRLCSRVSFLFGFIATTLFSGAMTAGQIPFPEDLMRSARPVPQEAMQSIYEEVKTPYKYGVILEAEAGEVLDCPNVFRHGERWYMVFVVNKDNVGYETHLAVSDDLLEWERLGKILPFPEDGWDKWQADAGLSLWDYEWGGSAGLKTFEGRYWMTYIGGDQQGYEPDPLSTGLASTIDPTTPREWERYAGNPILTPFQDGVRPFEVKTIYKTHVLHDPEERLGYPFVMYYNGKDGAGSGHEAIGMAVSNNMRDWIRMGDSHLIYNVGELRWSISGDPQIVKIGDLWVMFYFGAFWQPGAFDTFAASYDMVNWTKWKGTHLIEPSEPYDKQFAHKPWVLKHDGVVYHFYCAVGDQGRVIALATSRDLGRANPEGEGSRKIRFEAPAEHFTESLPLGNGRLGAMISGGIEQDRIVLNENGMWSGSPQDADRDGAAEALPEIRRLLLEGRNAEAEALVNETFTCAGEGSGLGLGADKPYGSYQMLGYMDLDFHYPESAQVAQIEDYSRTLDLADATALTRFKRGGVTYTREAFVSAPDEAFIQRYSANERGSISFDVTLSRPERAEVQVLSGGEIELVGELSNGRESGRGTQFSARLKVRVEGGSIDVSDGKIRVREADAAQLFVTAAADIRSFAGRGVEDASAAARADMSGLDGKAFHALRRAHMEDYQRYFDRVSLTLGEETSQLDQLSTVERLNRFASGGADPGLAALYFDFGRYLLISSSRPGGLPANLQGIWADTLQTPWNGDWHANINVQMNYWPAEVSRLDSLHEPLFDLIEAVSRAGESTAKAYFDAPGWVTFLLVNPWGFTSPGESARWGSTVSCSAWLCHHLWEHYRFSKDVGFLERAYPILKGAAEFYLAMLIELPGSGWLVTSPSNSPENAFLDAEGNIVHVCMGPTIDMQLLRFLFTATAEAAETLGRDADVAQALREAGGRLAPNQVGPDGRLQEWLEPYEEADPQHRHVAHLWGLYPGEQIDPYATPELAAAARATLDRRGDGSTGWSVAMKMAMWARLGDGNRAHTLFENLLKPADQETAKVRWSGGTFANLFCSHPPFQIDGNFGATAAIAEMLLQSHRGELRLLPALPDDWSSGSVKGLRARSGLRVDLDWEDKVPVRLAIRSEFAQTVRLRFGATVVDVDLPARKRQVWERQDVLDVFVK